MFLVVHVHIHVLADKLAEFIAASAENARASLLEPGVVRFDVVQSLDDPTRFVFVEVYRDEQAPVRHKETSHYAAWRDAVATMMASPRSNTRFTGLYPEGPRWETPHPQTGR
jgi:(4S)-4-hydroxy-5-phosphonooxypentane-2,3-dione isomerase